MGSITSHILAPAKGLLNLFPLPSFSLLLRSHRLPHAIFLSTRWPELAIVSFAASTSTSIFWLRRCQECPPCPWLGAAAVESLDFTLGQNQWLLSEAALRMKKIEAGGNISSRPRCFGVSWLRFNSVRYMWPFHLKNLAHKADWNGVCFKEGEQPDSLLFPHHNRSQEPTRCQASGGNDWGYVVNGSLSACLHLLL